jgi:hypothetical protein
MFKMFHNLALFWVKNANFFAEFFGKKNHNIGPRFNGIFYQLREKFRTSSLSHETDILRIHKMFWFRCEALLTEAQLLSVNLKT